MPRRRGLRPRLLAAVIRLNATSAFAAERQVVGQAAQVTEMWTLDHECGADLSAQVGRLENWLRSTLTAPLWMGVSFIERFWLEPTKTTVSHDAIVAAERYGERFAELMSAGYSWINFHAAGVLGGRLLVSVELPPGGPTGAPRTSVQLSGPFAFAGQRAGWKIDDLVAVA